MESGVRGICGSVLANDPKTVQEALLNTRIQHPGLIEAMQQLRLQKGAADPRVGDQNVFWVYNIQTKSYDTVRAELKFIGTSSYLWVALSEWNNGHVRSTEVDVMASALERSTGGTSIDPAKGILSIDRQTYGDPPNINSSFQKGKGDGKTHFLVCDIKDGFNGSGTYYAGFFFDVDVDPNSSEVSVSNRRDMVYIDSYPGIYFNGNYRTITACATMAHEFQHLIHWNYDPYEITFFNEGLSEYAQFLCGYGFDSPAGYLANTNVALLGWDETLEDYGRACLWTRFVADQYGLGFLRKLTQNPSTGIPGFESSLAQSGVSTTYVTTMMNFFTANWVGSGGQDPQYRYKDQLTIRATLRRDFINPNIQQKDTLVQQAVQYISFSGARNFRITFTLPGGVVVRAIESGPTALQVRDVSGGVEFASPGLGTTFSSIVFAVMNTQPVLPLTYSYSSYGEPLHFLAEDGYDSGTPHRYSQDQEPYVGFGNNAKTLGMAVQFQPAVKWNVLRKVRLMVAFNQEFTNGTALPTDKKNFDFHVWGDRNGKPGADIIPKFLVSVNRGFSPFGSFVDVDLAAYEKSLTNLAGPVYLGFMEAAGDSVGTYLAVDSLVKEDYSFVYRGPEYSNGPRDTWQTLREVSAMQQKPGELVGFNFMVRAVFDYSDSSAAPPLAIGYLQNPLLSEYIDVVAASPAELRTASISGTLSQTSGSSTLRFSAIPGTAKAFIDTTQKLNGSGPVALKVRAARKYGVIYTDTTISFTARLLKSDSPAIVTAPSGLMSIVFGEGSVEKPVYITVCDGSSSSPAASVPSSVLRTFSVGPSGFRPNRPGTVKVSGMTNDNAMTLVRLQEGRWLPVRTTRNQATGELSAEVDQLGVLGVAKRAEVGGELDIIPKEFSLRQNYPNPFNPSTTFVYDVPVESDVTLTVFDMLGRKLQTLVDRRHRPGTNEKTWNASALASGVYCYRIDARDVAPGSGRRFIQTKRMVLIK
jgi:hypothetical protein